MTEAHVFRSDTTFPDIFAYRQVDPKIALQLWDYIAQTTSCFDGWEVNRPQDMRISLLSSRLARSAIAPLLVSGDRVDPSLLCEELKGVLPSHAADFLNVEVWRINHKRESRGGEPERSYLQMTLNNQGRDFAKVAEEVKHLQQALSGRSGVVLPRQQMRIGLASSRTRINKRLTDRLVFGIESILGRNKRLRVCPVTFPEFVDE
jgi:hypothetical protein